MSVCACRKKSKHDINILIDIVRARVRRVSANAEVASTNTVTNKERRQSKQGQKLKGGT